MWSSTGNQICATHLSSKHERCTLVWNRLLKMTWTTDSAVSRYLGGGFPILDIKTVLFWSDWLFAMTRKSLTQLQYVAPSRSVQNRIDNYQETFYPEIWCPNIRAGFQYKMCLKSRSPQLLCSGLTGRKEQTRKIRLLMQQRGSLLNFLRSCLSIIFVTGSDHP